MANHTLLERPAATEIQYSMIKSLTSPEEKENGVQTWFANVNARDLLLLTTQDNLRTYIAEHKDSKRNGVHKEILSTIIDHPSRFINRNSGITVTCTACRVDDSKRTAFLIDASIINGAQTHGELKRYFEGLDVDDDSDFGVRVEIIMEPQREQIVEVAIARNTATAVKSVSQAGARGHLTDLKKAIERGHPGQTLQTSETDIVGLPAQSLLQWCRLLMPMCLEEKEFRSRNMPYKSGGKCLSEFSEWSRLKADDEGARRRHEFTVQIASQAVSEYGYWESHEGWNGQRLHERGKTSDKPRGGRPVRRQDGKVAWVAPGLLFPILSALSAFVQEDAGVWEIKKPTLFNPLQMIERACKQFRALGREVTLMGRSEHAYDALSIYTETISSVIKEQAE